MKRIKRLILGYITANVRCEMKNHSNISVQEGSQLELDLNVEKLPISISAKEKLPSFIKIVDGPSSLQCIVAVASTYLKIQRSYCFIDFPPELKDYTSLLEELIYKNEEIGKVIPAASYNVSIPFETYAKNIIGKHPLYAGLAFCKRSDNQVLVLMIKIYFLGCYRANQQNLDLRKSDKYRFCLFLRKLTQLPQGQAWLKSTVIEDVSSFSSLRSELINLKNSCKDMGQGNSLEWKKALSSQGLFLDVLCGTPARRRNTRSYVGRDQRNRKHVVVQGDEYFGEITKINRLVPGDEDDIHGVSEVRVIVDTNISDEMKLELQYADIEPNEVDPSVELVFNKGYSISERAQKFQDSLSNKGKERAIRAHNQYLYGSNQRLTDEDVIGLFNVIKEKTDLKEERLIRAALLSVFATGQSLEAIKALKLINSGDRTKQDYFEGAIYYDLDSRSWLVPSLDMGFKNPLLANASDISIQTGHPYIELPDVFSFKELIKLPDDVDRYLVLFESTGDLEAKVKKLISNSGERVTLTRIQKFLQLSCSSMFEAVTASLTFSATIPVASARKYYTVLDLEEIRKIYLSIAEPLSKIIPVDLTGNQTPKIDGAVGARYLPKMKHVKEVIRAILSKLELLRKEKAHGWWWEFHNLYTVYCLYTQGLLTGYRGVSQPFIFSKNLIHNNKIAVFSDKGTEDHFQERITPCHELVSFISREYEKHCQKAKRRLPDSSKLHGINLFFVEPDLSVVEARPKVITEKLNPYTSLPINSNRKLLRNYLTEKGCTPLAIDTLLGHGARGEKFWEVHSSRSMKSIYKELNGYMDLFSKELGVRVVKGFQR